MHLETPITLFIFFFQATSAPSTPPSQSTVTADQLKLSEPQPEKVPASYKQTLTCNGQKVVLQTSTIKTDSGLTIFNHENDNKTICIPVDDWLRTQLTTIEKFILSNVTVPSDVRRQNGGVYLYKPLWLQDKMLMSLSK